MSPISFLLLSSLLSTVPAAPLAKAPTDGPYHVIRTVKVGGDGGFDYVYADGAGRRLYVARSGAGNAARVNVFNLDTLEAAGEISNTRAHGAAVDPKSHHGFSSSSPMAMWDTKTMSVIKTIEVQGSPDGLLGDPSAQYIYVLSHRAPNVTVINAKDGTIAKTIDIGGAPEQAAVDGKGHLYIDIEDKGSVAVIDTKTLAMTTSYSLGEGKGGNAGLALDAKHHVLFVACREPASMVMVDSISGKVLGDLPISPGCDGAAFNPKTGECFSSQGDGTLTIIKETSPTTFVVEQTVKTMVGAKTLTLDPKTGHIFLIAAEYGPATGAPSTNGRQRRGPMIPGSFSIIEVGK